MLLGWQLRENLRRRASNHKHSPETREKIKTKLRAFYARKRAQKEEEERQRRIEAGLPPEPPPEEQAAVQAKKKAKPGKPVLPTVSTDPAPGEALGKREVQGLKDQQGLLASDSEEPKRKRKQVRSEAHRRAISEAIKKKWQDPQYQERQRQGMRRHFGQRTPKAVSADKRKAKQQTPRVQLTERERKLQMMAREARRLSERAEARVRLLREMVANGQPVSRQDLQKAQADLHNAHTLLARARGATAAEPKTIRPSQCSSSSVAPSAHATTPTSTEDPAGMQGSSSLNGNRDRNGGGRILVGTNR